MCHFVVTVAPVLLRYYVLIVLLCYVLYGLQGNYNGGAVYYTSVYTGEPMTILNLTNSAFIRNSADVGGALNTEEVAATITNCTFTGNKVHNLF
jgi:hypothetical protein